IVLGATVLRVNIAQATGFGKKDTTQVVASGRVSSAGGTLDMDVSGYKVIRIVVGSSTCITGDKLIIAVMNGGEVATFPFCSDEVSWVVELPGQTVRLLCSCSGGGFADVTV